MAYTDTAPGFDTLSYARRLKDAGVDDAQAEAHAEAARDHVVEAVATKAGIARLKADIARLEDKMATKADLYRALWVQTGIIAGIILGSFGGIVVALINLFPS